MDGYLSYFGQEGFCPKYEQGSNVMSSQAPQPNKMPRLNIISGASLSIVGLLFIFVLIPQFIEHQDVDRFVFSPSFFPYITAIILVLLSVLLVIQNVIKLKSDKQIKEEETEEVEILGFGWHESVNLLIFIAGSAAYIFMVGRIGFVLASILLLSISMYFSGVSKGKLVISSILLPVLIHQLLWHLLEFDLP